MGLLRESADPPKLCKFGRIVSCLELNDAGETLDDDDVAMLECERLSLHPGNGRKRGAGHFVARLARAGFTIGSHSVTTHLGGACRCPDGTPLKAS